LENNWKEGKFDFKKIDIPIEYKNEKVSVYCLQYNNEKIVIGMKNGKIIVYNFNYDVLYSINEHKSSVTCLQIDEEKIVSGSSDASIIISSISNGTILKKITNHKNRIHKLKFDKDILMSCSADRSLMIFDIGNLNTVNLIKDLALHEPKLGEHRWICNAVDLNVNYLVASISNKIGVWERNELFKFSGLNEAHDEIITCLFVYSERIVMSGSNDKTVRI
jgi:WD40 repeat protein